MRQGIALLTSVVTLTGMWLAGSHRWQGWLVGLLNQILWLAFIVAFAAWGLLPLCAALIVIYGRNLLRWRAEERELLVLRDMRAAEVRRREAPDRKRYA